ncbi:MAG: hypothetical protein M3527_03275 [Actinomycetota bacterium]|nr:hypothetical protein [Acidimicrobiia bacterium]MDQ3293460.1 hypothetical protein [Actinomycetota bacterium]
MTVLGLESEHVTMWWIALGMGLVVIVVVIVLLSLLVSLINDIDRNAAKLWNTATRVARNTATTWMLKDTAVASGVLHDEVALHAQLLKDKVAGK